MIRDGRCESTEEHDSHAHEVPVMRQCSGVLACGAQVHEPHEVLVIERLWCAGICGCGDTYRHPLHGPGEHK